MTYTALYCLGPLYSTQMYLHNLGFVTPSPKDGIIDDFPDLVWLGAGGHGWTGHSR